MILLIGGEKGGTGKSTIATNLAAWLATQGKDIMLLDADPQTTSAKWVARRNENNPELPKVHCTQKSGDIFDTVNDLAGRYDELIIDAGGRDSEELRTAMAISHVVYVPLRPSQADIETSVHVNNLIKMARGINRNLIARVLISLAPTNPMVTETQEAKELISELSEFELSNVFVRDRKIYRDAMTAGVGVVEMPSNKAKPEIQLLGQEIYSE